MRREDELIAKQTDPPTLTNLTIQVDIRVLAYARWQALKDATSVNAVLEEHLSTYAGVPAAPRVRRLPRPPSVRAIRQEAIRRHRAGWG